MRPIHSIMAHVLGLNVSTAAVICDTSVISSVTGSNLKTQTSGGAVLASSAITTTRRR